MKKEKIKRMSIIFLLIFNFLSEYTFASKNKILLICLDGADWDVINLLLKEGKIPTFKKLIEEGCWGNLQTIDPLTSEVIWTSIATGKSPHEHGIVDRLMLDPYTKELIPVTSNFIKVKRLWDILSDYKKRSLVVGYLVTTPVQEINGIIIRDRINSATYLSRDYSYPEFTKFIPPKEFYEFINVNRKNIFGIFSSLHSKDIDEENKNRIILSLKSLYHILVADRMHFKFTDYLLIHQDFDLTVFYQRASDNLQHSYWKCLFPQDFENVSEKEILLFKDIIKDYYIYYDLIISKLINNYKEPPIVMVVSDHGFVSQPYMEYGFDLNRILREIIVNHPEIKQYNNKIDFITEGPFTFENKEKNIRVLGMFTEEEFQKIKKLIIDTLTNIEVCQTGKRIFNYKRDTEFGFVIEIDTDYLIKFPLYTLTVFEKEYKIADFIIVRYFSANHDHYGVIVIHGPNIKKNKNLKSAHIYDIAPTVLYLLGLPVAKDMQGKVLTEAIDNNFLKKNPLRYVDTFEEKIKSTQDGFYRSTQDEEKIKEQMRSVGYIQ